MYTTLHIFMSGRGGGEGEVKRVFLEGLGKPPSETPEARFRGVGFLVFGGDRALPTASSGQ